MSENTKMKADPEKVETPVISWEAPEYFQYAKGKMWYMVAAGITGVSALLAFFTGNWSFAVAVLAFAGVYWYIHEHHPPRMTHIVISNMGIRVGEMFFPFSHIQAFWIIYENGVKTLNLHVAKRWISDVVIQLDSQDPVEVRSFLVGQIPEWEGKNERLGDMLLRILKL